MESCANCGLVIGKLETPHLWKGNVVCGDCLSKLNRQTVGAVPYASPAPKADPIVAAAMGRLQRIGGIGACISVVLGMLLVRQADTGGTPVSMLAGLCFVACLIFLLIFAAGRMKA